MVKTTTEMQSGSEAETRSEPQTINNPSTSRRYGMRISDASQYLARVEAYLNGDRSQVVRPEFADAVEGLGKRKIDFETLNRHEKRAFCGIDTRWQRGPDGILLWESMAFLNKRADSKVKCNTCKPRKVSRCKHHPGVTSNSSPKTA